MTGNKATSITVTVSLVYKECINITVIPWESLLWIRTAFKIKEETNPIHRLKNPSLLDFTDGYDL